jgi:hypothetical protein
MIYSKCLNSKQKRFQPVEQIFKRKIVKILLIVKWFKSLKLSELFDSLFKN